MPVKQNGTTLKFSWNAYSDGSLVSVKPGNKFWSSFLQT